ncbi:DUF1876 domain-containing protein [Streptomyces sp. NPDC002889]|uniref:DUF1876 domain-containing protein n=1 Tax=Streptomyces sp. NPDC002889 TaxID=3364669 RepID=UPI00369D0396
MTRTIHWKVDLFLSEQDGTTTARAVLDTGTAQLSASGMARCSPQDADVPEIGDELAAARAMKNLSLDMMRVAYHDVESKETGSPGRPAGPAFGWSELTT